MIKDYNQLINKGQDRWTQVEQFTIKKSQVEVDRDSFNKELQYTFIYRLFQSSIRY